MPKNYYHFIAIAVVVLFLSLSLTTNAMANQNENLRALLVALVGRLQTLQTVIGNNFSVEASNLKVVPITPIEGEVTAYYIDPPGAGDPRLEYSIRDRDGKEIPLRLPASLALTSRSRVRISNAVQGSDGFLVVVDINQIQILSSPSTAAPLANTTGDQPLAVLLVNFLDSGPNPFTAMEIGPIIFNGQFQNFYREQSYGKISWSGQVYDWQKLNRNGQLPNGTCPWPGFQNSAELNSLINTAQVDLTRYQRILVLANHPCVQGGLSSIGQGAITINGQIYQLSFSAIGSLDVWNQTSNRGAQPFPWTNLDRLLSHELGHSLGLRHSNGWDCGEQVFIGNCRHIEYGNSFDNMGGLLNGGYALHFNGYQKELLGWLSPESVLTIATSGRYTLAPLETRFGRGSQIKIAKVLLPPDPNPNTQSRSLYLEYRRGIGFDANLNQPWLIDNQKGLMANLQIKNNANWNVQLLDLSPTIAGWLPDITQTTLNAPDENQKTNTEILASALSSLSLLSQSQMTTPSPNVVISDQIPDVMLGPVVSASPSGLTFDIGLGDNPCFRLPPEIGNTRTTPQTNPGGQTLFRLLITNSDYYGCPPAVFSFSSPNQPDGVSLSFSTTILDIAPRQTVQNPLTLSVSTSTPTGIYPFTIEATNLATGLTGSRLFYLRVY